MKSWGKHLWIDAEAGNENVSSEEKIREFFDELIIAIDMVKFGDLWIQRFATHDINKSGYSAFQMIETSNVAGHFVDKNGDFYLDIFSCKDFDQDTVLNLVKKYFNPTAITCGCNPRGTHYVELEN